MSKYSGYMDRVAKFDLTTGKLEDYPWSDKEKELYLGGKMMAAKILYDNLTGKEEAFSEENMIVISTGPLTGTGAPSSSRFNISTISPQTGIIASSNCGGNFGYYLKKAGYDAPLFSPVNAPSIPGSRFITTALFSTMPTTRAFGASAFPNLRSRSMRYSTATTAAV